MEKNVRHWSVTRLTSLPLIPLFFYFVSEAEYITTKSRMELVGWMHQPAVAASLLLFIACGFWHAKLGMEEIIIDYGPAQKMQSLCLSLNKFFFLILGAACAYAVLAISFGES
jgi:succinate dehydrogenase / fumarate reductase membrane anchor subunit